MDLFDLNAAGVKCLVAAAKESLYSNMVQLLLFILFCGGGGGGGGVCVGGGGAGGKAHSDTLENRVLFKPVLGSSAALQTFNHFI